MRGKHWLSLIVSFILAFGAGYLGAQATIPQIGTWYAGLAKSPLTPPSWVFAPVWNTLYALMALAAWLVWNRRLRLRMAALMLYGVQLGLNAYWSMAFFGAHNPKLALWVIGALLLSLIATAVLFWKVDRRAGFLMLPYLGWVSFAAYLNYSIVVLN